MPDLNPDCTGHCRFLMTLITCPQPPPTLATHLLPPEALSETFGMASVNQCSLSFLNRSQVHTDLPTL